MKYTSSLSTARRDIDDAARKKAEIDVKVARLRDDLAEYRSRYYSVPTFHPIPRLALFSVCTDPETLRGGFSVRIPPISLIIPPISSSHNHSLSLLRSEEEEEIN